ncbi:MAG TPA: methylenetetrahydrofolate reductase [NAD(P)H] [Dehalococcoidia bacterium]|nr:methylenetetrahydrofolate reductase [NAD(P)H] [Dehalococcoidia bacterium]
MKIGELIKKHGSSLSFEFFPPKDETAEAKLFQTVAQLKSFKPTFVSVTYGAGGGAMKNTRHIILRLKRETPLTAMPHLTCVDQSMDELAKILGDYKEHGIDNVLALRGDPPKGAKEFVAPKNGFCYATDLVKLAVSIGGYSIGVAVYPEGHIEAPSLEMDMHYTKQKIDAGADFAITQMFFDNHFFYDFLERAEKAGIAIPIIPGILPITDFERITKFSQKSGATMPDHIARRFSRAGASPEEAEKIAIEVATEQCADLLENGISYFHFYTLNQSRAVTAVVNNLSLERLGLKISPAGE